jgi:hypothetical protein
LAEPARFLQQLPALVTPGRPTVNDHTVYLAGGLYFAFKLAGRSKERWRAII